MVESLGVERPAYRSAAANMSALSTTSVPIDCFRFSALDESIKATDVSLRLCHEATRSLVWSISFFSVAFGGPSPRAWRKAPRAKAYGTQVWQHTQEVFVAPVSRSASS